MNGFELENANSAEGFNQQAQSIESLSDHPHSDDQSLNHSIPSSDHYTQDAVSDTTNALIEQNKAK
jgi:hypothetical protein